MDIVSQETINILDHELQFIVKRITVREVYDALAKNGFEHLRETWFGEDDPVLTEKNGFKPTKGCVLAQTAFNLGVSVIEDNLYKFIQKLASSDYSYLSIYYEELAHYGKYTLHNQLNKFEVSEDSKWYSDTGEETVGQTIIYWNDKIDGPLEYDSKGEPILQYALKTYAEVAAMAYDVMQPHFDKTIEVLVAGEGTGIPLAI